MSNYDNFIISVRKRPFDINKSFSTNNINDVINTSLNTVSIREEKQKFDLQKYQSIKTFKFDYVFSEQSSNLNIYRSLFRKKIDKKKNIICYTFGETGSGKTFTLFGKCQKIDEELGLIEIVLYDLLKNKSTACISALEIYNNNLYDLIENKSKVNLYENGGNVHILGLKTFNCAMNNIEDLIKTIMNNRKIGQTSENLVSSRSHVIIKIIHNNSTIIFADIAGCERGTKSNTRAQSEMIHINRDNFALRECMRNAINLNKKNYRIPFRLSKLTMILKDSFSEKYDTLVIATLNPHKDNTQTTLNILSYVNDFKMYVKPDTLKLPIIKNNDILKMKKSTSHDTFLLKEILDINDKENKLLHKCLEADHPKIFELCGKEIVNFNNRRISFFKKLDPKFFV